MQAIRVFLLSALVLAAGSGLLGCAEKAPVAKEPAAPTASASAAPAQPASPAVVLQADSFLFKPNLIRAKAGSTLRLAVTNVGEQIHELMVKNPAGEVVVQAVLPPHQTVEVSVPLPEAGDYPFECAQGYHAKLGMTGRIVAE